MVEDFLLKGSSSLVVTKCGCEAIEIFSKRVDMDKLQNTLVLSSR